MTHNLVSSQVVLAKVWRDWKPQTQDWTTDAIEWISEIVRRVGAYPMLVNKSEKKAVTGHRCTFPCDLESLTAVEYNGVYLPFGGDVAAADLINEDSTRPVYSGYQGADYYSLNPGYLITSFEKGTIKFHYRAFPLDAEGFPMLPDNYFFLEACSLQIVKNLQRRGDLKGTWEKTAEDAEMFAEKASRDISFWTPEKAERFLSRWVRLVTPRREVENFYVGSESPEFR